MEGELNRKVRGSVPTSTLLYTPHILWWQAMVALGEERAFLADTTQKLDTSLEERDRLLDEVAEAKIKVKIT